MAVNLENIETIDLDMDLDEQNDEIIPENMEK